MTEPKRYRFTIALSGSVKVIFEDVTSFPEGYVRTLLTQGVQSKNRWYPPHRISTIDVEEIDGTSVAS